MINLLTEVINLLTEAINLLTEATKLRIEAEFYISVIAVGSPPIEMTFLFSVILSILKSKLL